MSTSLGRGETLQQVEFQPSITDRTRGGISLQIGPYNIDVTRAERGCLRTYDCFAQVNAGAAWGDLRVASAS